MFGMRAMGYDEAYIQDQFAKMVESMTTGVIWIQVQSFLSVNSGF